MLLKSTKKEDVLRLCSAGLCFIEPFIPALLIPLICLILLSSHFNISAESITLPSEQEISIEEYGSATSKNHIIWMHSERGIRTQLQKLLRQTSEQQDLHILLPDWLDSYFISPSRSSLEMIPLQDVEDFLSVILNKYTDNGASDTVYIVAGGRAAGLVLNATHHLQTQSTKAFNGIIMISPYLQTQTPKAGQDVTYQEITAYSNLPLYIIQAERSPRFVPLSKLVSELEKGGSPLFVHRMKDIRGGFHARNKEDLKEIDLQARAGFPKQLQNALKMLSLSKAAPLKPLLKYTRTKRKRKPLRLQAVDIETPKLMLQDLKDIHHNISDYKGKVVLVSFWASWCQPCIEEMPSLVALKEKYRDHLEVLAINVREDKETILKFTHKMNINFPILKDPLSVTTKDWKVFVYPSNYIVNKAGKLVYAATGAMDWQESNVESIIEGLLITDLKHRMTSETLLH